MCEDQSPGQLIVRPAKEGYHLSLQEGWLKLNTGASSTAGLD